MSHFLKMENRILIQQLLALGWSYRRIETETGIRQETISQYDPKHLKSQFSGLDGSANSATLPTDPPNQNRPNCPPTLTTSAPSSESKILPPTENPAATVTRPSHSGAAVYDAIIRQKLSHGLTAQRIYQDLVTDNGFTSSYDCVKRYIRQLKQQQPKAFARLHTRPGDEAQVDFGLAAPILKNGRYVRPWFFKMVLSHSRHSYEEAVWQQDVETFLRCHERAFAVFGGVPRVIRLDNLKSGVLSAQLYEPVLNPVYAAFAKHAGFAPLPCLPRKPEHNLMVVSNWLRILAMGKQDYIDHYVSNISQFLLQMAEYDTRLRHLLEVTETLMECRQFDLAKQFAIKAIGEASQIRSVRRLHDWIILFRKILRIGRELNLPDFPDQLFKEIEDWYFAAMLTFENNTVLSAYTHYMLSSSEDNRVEKLKQIVIQKQSAIIDAARDERRTIYKSLALIFAEAPLQEIRAIAENSIWPQPWERGLAALILRPYIPPKIIRLPKHPTAYPSLNGKTL